MHLCAGENFLPLTGIEPLLNRVARTALGILIRRPMRAVVGLRVVAGVFVVAGLVFGVWGRGFEYRCFRGTILDMVPLENIVALASTLGKLQ